MRHVLTNLFHDELRTTVILTEFDEAQRKEKDMTVIAYLEAEDPIKYRRVLKRLDNSEPGSVYEIY